MPKGSSRAYICIRKYAHAHNCKGHASVPQLIVTAECARVLCINAMNRSIVHFLHTLEVEHKNDTSEARTDAQNLI